MFFIALAGYYYILGGESAKEKAKTLISSVIAGLVIIFASFILLKFINPDLIHFKTIQPPQLSGVGNLPDCSKVGLGDQCALTTTSGQIGAVGDGQGGGIAEKGQCTVSNLSACGAWNVSEAMTICQHESQGLTDSQGGADPCGNLFYNGKPVAISYGLFQINLKDSTSPEFPECQGVLTYTKECLAPLKTLNNGKQYCPSRKCVAPKGQAALDKCIAAITSKERNIKQGCNMFQKNCWSPWTTASFLSTKTCKK